MATVADVLDIAYSRNKRAQRGDDATDEELWKVIEEVMGRYFAMGQRVNLEWFTTMEPVVWQPETEDPMSGRILRPYGWSRPPEAESVHLIMMKDGTEVAKVPFDQQDAEPVKPAVYRIGDLYRPVEGRNGSPPPDNRLDPENEETLTFYYCRRPNPVEGGQLDLMWPQGHETLLGIEVALFLARKDNRTEDWPALEAQRDEQAMRFFEFLEHEDRGTVYPQGRVRRWSYGPSMASGGGG